eukprot:gene5138-5222_t
MPAAPLTSLSVATPPPGGLGRSCCTLDTPPLPPYGVIEPVYHAVSVASWTESSSSMGQELKDKVEGMIGSFTAAQINAMSEEQIMQVFGLTQVEAAELKASFASESGYAVAGQGTSESSSSSSGSSSYSRSGSFSSYSSFGEWMSAGEGAGGFLSNSVITKMQSGGGFGMSSASMMGMSQQELMSQFGLTAGEAASLCFEMHAESADGGASSCSFSSSSSSSSSSSQQQQQQQGSVAPLQASDDLQQWLSRAVAGGVVTQFAQRQVQNSESGASLTSGQVLGMTVEELASNLDMDAGMAGQLMAAFRSAARMRTDAWESGDSSAVLGDSASFKAWMEGPALGRKLVSASASESVFAYYSGKAWDATEEVKALDEAGLADRFRLSAEGGKGLWRAIHEGVQMHSEEAGGGSANDMKTADGSSFRWFYACSGDRCMDALDTWTPAELSENLFLD